MKKGKVVVCRAGKDRWSVIIENEEKDGLQRIVRDNNDLLELVVNFVEMEYEIYVEDYYSDRFYYKGYKVPKDELLSKVPNKVLNTSKDVAENAVHLYYAIKKAIEDIEKRCMRDEYFLEFEI